VGRPAAGAAARRRGHLYQGTADAVFQNLDIIRSGRARVHRRAGRRPHLQDGLRRHAALPRRARRPLHGGCFEVPIGEASAFGVMAVNDEGRIVEFVEKPPQPPAMPGRPTGALASRASTSSTPSTCTSSWRATRRPAVGATTSAATWCGGGRAGRGLRAAVRRRLRAQRARRAVILARRRHDRRLWEANIDLTATKPQLNRRPQLADLDLPGAAAVGQVRAQPKPTAAAWRSSDGLWRLHHLRRPVSVRCVLQRPRALLSTVNWSVLLPGVQVGRRARLTRAVIDRGCMIPTAW